MKYKLLVFFILYVGFNAFSQDLRGTVLIGSDPLPGVNVINLTNGKGTLTNFDGNFILTNVSQGDEIEFSYIGFESQKITYDGQTNISVVLTESSEQLDEVYVTGYGSQIRKNLSSVISKVDGDLLANTPVPSFEGALQGRVAGVQITSGSGMSGSSVKVRIRGTGSVLANADPLYVIDGVVVPSGGYDQNSYDPQGDNYPAGAIAFQDVDTNVLSTINPNDIESIEVLKDASATAIYGSRGANGVILITTKKGSYNGKTVVEANFDYGISEATRKLDLVNAEEYLMLAQEAWYNSGNNPIDFWSNSGILQDGLTKEEALTNNTNWQDQGLRTGFSNKMNLSISGGADSTRFFASFNALEEESIFVGNEYMSLATRLNLDHKINDKLKLSINSSFTSVDNSPVPSQDGIGRAMDMIPLWPVYKADGSYFYPERNPTANLELWEQQRLNKSFIGNWSLEYKFIDNFKFITDFGYNFVSTENKQYRDGLLDPTGETFAMQRKVNKTASTFKNLINYTNVFGDHNVDVLVGIEAQKNSYDSSNLQGAGYDISTIKTPADAERINGFYEQSSSTFLSYFSRLNYDYRGKYLLSLTARRDASSRFGKNNQWGFFPAASVGYNISEESFFDSLRPVVNYLKFRVSYGISGNASIPDYAQYSSYVANNYQGGLGLSLDNIGDDELSWESTTSINYGISFQLFDGKVKGEVDIYKKTTDDLLLQIPIAGSAGVLGSDYMTSNVGTLENKGVELGFNFDLVENDDFYWTAGFNVAQNINELKSLGLLEGIDIGGLFGATTLLVGSPVGIQNLADWVGVDPASGQDLWKELSGDILTTGQAESKYGNLENFLNNNRGPSGNPYPDFTGGFNTSVEYKNWYGSVLFTFEYGAEYLAAGETKLAKFPFATMSNNIHRQQLNRWRNPGDITNVSRLTTDPVIWSDTDEFVSPVDFLRMRDLTFGYRFQPSSGFINNVNLYVKLTNYLTFTNAKPWLYDPENYRTRDNTNALGKYKSVPQAKSINVGLNLKF